jgi:WD40 repeat protein
MRLWDPAAGQMLHILKEPLGDVFSVAFSPDGQMLASGLEVCTVRMRSITAKQVWCLYGHMAPVLSVAFSPDGQVLASGSVDKTVRLWAIHE